MNSNDKDIFKETTKQNVKAGKVSKSRNAVDDDRTEVDAAGN
jgi:hypothetical protein